MSVSNGQTANQTTFNNAFVSKTALTGNDVTGIINLNNASSGGNVTNAQRQINRNTKVIQSTATVTASGSVTLDQDHVNHIVPVVGDGGAVTMSSTPFGTSGTWLDGTEVTLVGTSNTDTVTIQFSDAANGAILNGNATLSQYYSITLVWLSALNRWIEKCRNF